MKVGFVSLIGRPNVGKSTLLNSLLNLHLAITSNVPSTTRNIIQGIYEDEDAQIVFIDTPGIHKPTHKLGNLLNKKAYQNGLLGTDLILFLVDAESGIGKGDQFILKKLEGNNVPVFLLLNKIDKMKKEKLLSIIDQAKDLYPFQEIIPISALKLENIDHLIQVIKTYLEEGEPFFESGELTNVSTKFILAEFVREQLMRKLKDEIPHSITCYVENYSEEENLIHIDVLIVVDRANLKKIIIGKNGSMLKEVGSLARKEMEKFLGKKVFLKTYVKTIENWRDEEKYLIELGLQEDE